MNDTDLPRVLFIGDSITRAYYPAVELNLKGRAYVARVATSKAIGDPSLIGEIRTFLTEARFDVVHFNIGMHGWAYSEDEYRRNLPVLAAAIKEGAPGAKLNPGQHDTRPQGPRPGRYQRTNREPQCDRCRIRRERRNRHRRPACADEAAHGSAFR